MKTFDEAAELFAGDNEEFFSKYDCIAETVVKSPNLFYIMRAIMNQPLPFHIPFAVIIGVYIGMEMEKRLEVAE